MSYVGLIVWTALLIGIMYAWARNWSDHVPPGSSPWRKIGVALGYLAMTLFCLMGVIGSIVG